MDAADVQAQLETLSREEFPRLVARIARITGEFGVAEELAQDVLLSAVERWPGEGMPDNPAAWLTIAGRRRAIDRLRQRQVQARVHGFLGIDAGPEAMPAPDDSDLLDDDIGDDLLRLVFTACHPALGIDSQVALALRVLGGLSVAAIARAYLVPEATVAQRIVRAKRTLAGYPFAVPRRAELPARRQAVLDVVHLVFNEGYAATAGVDWVRPELCAQALRLGRLLAELMPGEAAVHGQLALMELQASRLAARCDARGRAILLEDQDRSLWDRSAIRRGVAALERALVLGGREDPKVLQAAIAACHARAATPAATDWPRIAALYARLQAVLPSPVVQLNRAVAISRAWGAPAAWPLVEALAREPRMQEYAPFAAARGDLLEKLGRHQEARAEFLRAAQLTGNEAERGALLRRAGGAG